MQTLSTRETAKTSRLEMAAYAYFNDRSENNLKAVMDAGKAMVIHFGNIYSGGHLNDDLIQAGYEGLLKALKRYTTVENSSFSTFAGCYIIGEIRHYIRKELSYYRPDTILKLRSKVDSVIEKQFKESGNIVPLESLSQELNINEEGIYQAMSYGITSFEEVDITKIHSLRYEHFKLPIEDRIFLHQAIHKLSDIQRKVVCLLFFHDYTQQQVANKLGFNQRKVSRVLEKSISILRSSLSNNF